MNITGQDVYAATREIHEYQKMREHPGNFDDVKTSDWYYDSVVKAYSYDLANGKGETKFDPQGNITIAEAITMAAKVHSYGTFGKLSPSIQMEADPWYTLFVRYAETQGIISEGEFNGQYNQSATRDQLAHIFANVLPDNGYQQINVVSKLPDIDSRNPYYNDVVKLYNAGIISGNDYSGTFTPKENISRAEASAIVSRLILPSTRVTLTFCQSIAFPSEDNSFGPLKQIGTQVVKRPDDFNGRADTPDIALPTTSTTTVAKTDTNKNTSSSNNSKKSDTSSKSQSKDSNDDDRYNYNHTWDYETNSMVDKPNSSSNNQSKEPADSSSSSMSHSPNISSNDDNDYEDADETYEFKGKIYYDYDEYMDALGEDARIQEQYNIEHYAEGTLELVNEARAEEGLPPLTLDPNLVEAAQIRAKELCEYYSHTRPDGRRGSSVIDDLDIPCTDTAENIAKGSSTSINIQAWLNSSGHKE